MSQCSTGVSGADCSDSRPPDQLTCAELKETYACADYCATLCTHAPSCGSFDSKLCAQGCALRSPPVCNSASVSARTCDQLKPELRDYEDVARAEQGGSHIDFGFGGKTPYGLCTKGDDCDLPLGCSLETNTCAPCASDADCKRSSGIYKYLCTEQKECVQVDCATDADCVIGVCDSQRHECAECRDDADCTGFYKHCNTQTATCVACVSNEDCSGTTPLCDSSTNRCTECLSNADCKGNAREPRCDPQLKFCTVCREDADCAAFGHAVCSNSSCVACRADTDCAGTDNPVCIGSSCMACREDADCKAAGTPACDASVHQCVACNRPEHCPDGMGCDPFGHVCVALPAE